MNPEDIKWCKSGTERHGLIFILCQLLLSVWNAWEIPMEGRFLLGHGCTGFSSSLLLWWTRWMIMVPGGWWGRLAHPLAPRKKRNTVRNQRCIFLEHCPQWSASSNGSPPPNNVIILWIHHAIMLWLNQSPHDLITLPIPYLWTLMLWKPSL